MNITLISLGCSKNLVDSEILIGGLKKHDCKVVPSIDGADTVIINTCGFLDTAREESINQILDIVSLKEQNKVKKIIVMGCMSERYANDMRKEIPEVDAFYGTTDHNEIIGFITGKPFSKLDPDYNRSVLTPKHYAYLKIAEGCDNGCTFCSIPLMRGLQKSQPISWNHKEALRLANQGAKELLVIAQDSTSYGWDLNPRVGLHDLMDELNTIESLEWIRLHYAHPAHLHTKMIDRFKILDRLIPYIDMPVQHGSDRMLKLMRRGLKTEGILKKIDALRNANDQIAIRTSIIVGFPGESDQDFEDLYRFVEQSQFDRLGVFTYSEEDGTYGAQHLKDDVPKKIKNQRMDDIMLLQQKISLEKNKQLIGTSQKILVDATTEDGYSICRTYRDAPEIDNYVRVDEILEPGKFYEVDIKEAYPYDLLAKVKN